MKDITRHYTNGEVTIVWKPALCIHSTICWKQATGLPEVFHPATRPWITPEAAATARIVEQVQQCPSGALSFFMNGDAAQETAAASSAIAVAEVTRNGPLLIHGDITVKHPDGTETKRTRMTAFCRCGGSGNKPYCDGTHNKIGFKG
jgi:uncharacterized Fe-S cluster protein YjdI